MSVQPTPVKELVVGQRFMDPEYDDVLTVESVELEGEFAFVVASGLELIYGADHCISLLDAE